MNINICSTIYISYCIHKIPKLLADKRTLWRDRERERVDEGGVEGGGGRKGGGGMGQRRKSMGDKAYRLLSLPSLW